MKTKDEREKLEDLLNNTPDRIAQEDVPTPGNIPEELQAEAVIDLNFAELKEKCDDDARIMINNAIGFILTPEMIKNNPYIVNKLEVDVMSLSGMIYQMRVNEAAQKAMLDEINRGFMHPRMFEVLAQLSGKIIEINKQLLQTVEAIKVTYKDVKDDIREKETEALGTGNGEFHALDAPGQGMVSMGSKEMIKRFKDSKKSSSEPEDIEEIK